MMLSFTLPFPPSIGHYWATAPSNGRRIISANGRQYRKAVLEEIMLYRADKALPFAPLTGRLSMTLIYHYKDRRDYDLDNFPKSVQDALQKAGIFQNDSQIDHLLLHRGAVTPGRGSLSVLIEEIPD